MAQSERGMASDWTAAAACVNTSSLRRLYFDHTPATGPTAHETICTTKVTMTSSRAEGVSR